LAADAKMPGVNQPQAIFMDVGGVLLTNGWDHAARERAAAKFGIDPSELERRHAPLARDLDVGRVALDTYLEQVFGQARRAEARVFVEAQSAAFPDALSVLGWVASARRYLLCALNNESTELNAYRIGRFGLARYFSLFFSSCYVGLAKPEPAIFKLALNVTRRAPEEVVFVDDRPENVEAARGCGLRVIHYRTAPQLRAELEAAGVG
jgi:putative hydrolase of the HAD superfamily